MTVLRDEHEAHGASFSERGGRSVVADYGKPDRTVQAVRNGVGTIEAAYGILVVEGGDRVDYVDNAVSNAVPREEGSGCYAVLLDPDGRIRTDLYVYHAGERLLIFVPPGQAEPLAAEWREKTFIEDVTFDVATGEFGVFGVHGPHATEKIASVFTGGTPPEDHLTFDRGSFDDAGVTVIRTDSLAGEEGYEVVCDADRAATVFDVLVNQGLNAVPFGHRSWEVLTLESGTPLFETELDDAIPNAVGLRNALDFEKGCYVGQEVVSRIENRGAPPKRLVGVELQSGGDPDGADGVPGPNDGDDLPIPDDGTALLDGDEAVGEITRAAVSPTVGAPIGLALVDADRGTEAGTREDGELTVRIDGHGVAARLRPLPFHEGSDRSARVPSYPD